MGEGCALWEQPQAGVLEGLCRVWVREPVPWASVPRLWVLCPTSTVRASGLASAGSWVEGRPSVMYRLSPLVGQ